MSNRLKNRNIDQLEIASRLVGYASGTRYRVRAESLFNGVPLEGTHVLDIGCGNGEWAIWTALNGAAHVIGIEPEAHGSTPNTLATFRKAIETLGLSEKVTAGEYYLHQLPPQKNPFDIAVMYNVINHLDEEAVVSLHHDRAAVERYVEILRDLRSRMRPNGWVVVADCGRDNFWLKLGLSSPFAPTIEWQKHQNPQTWIEVFKDAGFRSFDLHWSPLQPFPRLTGNWLAEYLTCSHFVLRLRVTPNPALVS